MATPPLRIAVVDEHYIVRQGLTSILNAWPHGQVVLQAEHGLAYEKACAEVGHIHMAYINMHMPVRNGVETIRWIKRNQPRTLVVAFSPNTSPHLVQSAVQAGARGFLHQGATQEEVHRAAETVQRNGLYYNQHMSKALHRAWKAADENKSPHALLEKLAPRMLEFLLLYARVPFPTYADIAKRMDIEESCVESHRKAVRKRTGCRTREEMIDLLVRAGRY